MASIGKIVGTLEAQSGAFSKGTQAAGTDLDQFRKKVQAGRLDVNAFQRALDGLKSGAGRGSTLDELGKTLRGAGAVAGIGLLGEGLKNASGKAAELSEQFRKGEVDASGMAVGIGKSLPIFGSFIEAGQNIREMFTHEKEQIDTINKVSEITNALVEARVKLIADTRKEIREYGREAAEANAKVIEATLAPGQRKTYEIDFAFGNKQADLKQKVEDQLKGIDDAVKAQRDKLSKDLLAMQTQLSHATGGTKDYKTLKDGVDQIRASMQALTNTAKDQKEKLSAAAQAASVALTGEQRVSEREGVLSYLEDLQKKLDELNPDPVGKVRDEVKGLGGNANDTQKALDLLAKTQAADAYKKNAEGLAEWSKALDETAAKIEAVRAGADEKTAEQWAKLGTDDAGQRAQFEALSQRQSAEDAALKTIEQQKRVVEEITQLQKEAAQVGMTEAQKKVDDLKRDGANAAQLAQAQALQKQADAAERFKTDQEEAKKLIEQSLTPLDKFNTEATKIDQLFAEGLLTAKQASDALDKAGRELGKDDKDENKHAGAVTRRFDFSLPREPKHQDANKQLIDIAKQNLADTHQIRYYQQQLYNFGQTANQNATQVANF